MLSIMKLLHWCCALWTAIATMGSAYADTVTIAAASSLSSALTDFSRDEDVSIIFGSSSRLTQQLEAGLDADIVILADARWMNRLEESGRITNRTALLSNQLVVIGSRSLENAERIGIGALGVPVGDYAREALDHWGMLESVEERLIPAPSASAVLAHVDAGYVDAAVVYRSDAMRAQNAQVSVALMGESHRPIEYTSGLTPAGSENPVAIDLLERLRSDDARALFLAHGFTAPPESVLSAPAAGSSTPAIDTREPLLRSVWVAMLALLLSLPPAIGLGWLLARKRFAGKALLNTVCLAPLVLPPVVTGWLLLKISHWAGFSVAFTPWAAVMAAAVVGFPLLMILIRGAIESVDIRYEQQAQTLGLTALGAFRRVTLPMALPGVAAGCVLAFARALGEFGATAMFAGDQPDSTRTLALAVYAATEVPGGDSAAATLVVASLVITLLALLAYERLVWRQRRRREDWS